MNLFTIELKIKSFEVPWKKPIILIFCCFFFVCLSAQNESDESYFQYHLNDSVLVLPRKPVKAAIEVVGLNLGVWAFDRYVSRGKFAYIGWNTMKSNIRHGFVWDNDKFSTNLFAHPYHGGLYFNAARSNGMNFWESIPYTVGGSLMWEFFMENEPPAINDFMATSVGGICLGEATFRLSDLLIDDRSAGFTRFGREFLVTLVSPMRGLNRIISGDAWKVRTFKGRSFESFPARFYVTAGYRGLAEDSEIKDEFDNGMYVDLRLIYGDPWGGDNNKPYDSFTLRTTFNLFSYQPLISNVNAIGQIWGKDIPLKSNKYDMRWGIFQHFDYYDSDARCKGVKFKSYRISEAAAFGVGGLFRANLSHRLTFVSSVYLNAILLGGSLTDYFQVIDRDYNMGSGYSSKINAGLLIGTKMELSTNFEDYRLYTWKGYDPEVDLSQLTHEEQLYLNAQGDKGKAKLTVLNLNFNYRYKKRYTFSVETSYYFRGSTYKYFPDVSYEIIESKVGMGYLF